MNTYRTAALALMLATTALMGAGADSPQATGSLGLTLSTQLGTATAAAAPPAPTLPAVKTVAGMPTVQDPKNLYSETGANHLGAAVKGHLERIYVPNLRSNNVSVIDPGTLKVVATLKVGRSPQHVVPSWDLSTLWVANNAERGNDGSLTPIDPKSAQAGKSIPVDDPYNVYFTPDGASLIVVAEAKRRLDFRDPKTLTLQHSIATPNCGGINHADFSIDGQFALFTCEFDGAVIKIDLVNRAVAGFLKLKMPTVRFRETKTPASPAETEICTSTKGMPQDIRISPDGKRFFVADMMADGVHILGGQSLAHIGFVATGLGTHGLYPSRDGKKLYVANRGTHQIHGKKGGPGRVTVIDFATSAIEAQWEIPGGGSPDMGNVSADGKWLWLSGRYDDMVYRFDTATGAVVKIPVGAEPHGLTVWPQPGRYSLGHTGNMR